MSQSRSTRDRFRRLQMEQLEARRVLAQATLVTHTFREDDFAIAGDFTYRQHSPEDFDYIDTINNGRYASTKGHIKWTSDTTGQGFFEGTATGDGRDTVQFGVRRNCSEYGIEDKGRFDFTVNAQTSTLKMSSVDATSTRYTYYRDLTGGHCQQPNPPWSRFFGGFSSNYVGSFSASTHKVAVNYDQVGPEVKVVAPLADLKWTNTTATDLELLATPIQSVPEVPNGWTAIEQTTSPPPSLSFVDVKNGGVSLTVNLSGKPLKTATPQTPVATVRAFWAATATDTSGAEIPIASVTSPVGLFWNSSKLQATIRQFPTPPPTAKFIRLTVVAPVSVDANSANSTRFLPIGGFQARDSALAPISEDLSFDGTFDSVLHPLERSDPSIRAFAYRPVSDLGAMVQVISDAGAYYYDPTFVDAIQAIGAGETVFDTVRFLAIKNQALLDEVAVTVPVRGENDTPFADQDFAVTTNFTPLAILSATLLANDTDPDRNDVLRLQSVDETSGWGAAIHVVLNDAQTEIQQIVYDPSKSAALRGLEQGATIQDGFGYEITDRAGATSFGYVIVEVTGEDRVLTILPIDSQYTITGAATNPIPVFIEEPDGDFSDVELTAVADNANLVPPEGIEISSGGGVFNLTITPATGLTGRTVMTLTARNGVGQTATEKFHLVVGSDTDLDLDGVPNEIEDAGPFGGDMNQDGVVDSQQAHVSSVRMRNGDSFLNLATAPDQVLANVVAEVSPDPANAASGALFPLGLLQFEVLGDLAGATSNLTVRTDYSALALNRVFQFDGPVGQESAGESTEGLGWVSIMHNKRDGARVFADRVVVNLRDGGRGDLNTVADGLIHATVALGHVPHPWRNLVREDVDNDGVVAPIDVLLLVNQLNNFGPRFLGQFPTGDQSLPNFLDPSGNDSLEPIDVLIVINYLNHQGTGGEQESAAESASSWPTSGFLPDRFLAPAQSLGRELSVQNQPDFNQDLQPLMVPPADGADSTFDYEWRMRFEIENDDCDMLVETIESVFERWGLAE